MVLHQMTFFHLAFPVLSQTPQHLPEVSAQLSVDDCLPVFGDEHHVILTGPFRVV